MSLNGFTGRLFFGPQQIVKVPGCSLMSRGTVT